MIHTRIHHGVHRKTFEAAMKGEEDPSKIKIKSNQQQTPYKN